MATTFSERIEHKPQAAFVVGYMRYDRDLHDCRICRASHEEGRAYGERVRANIARNASDETGKVAT